VVPVVLIYFLFISGIRENDLKKCMTDIPVTDGMIELLKYCQDVLCFMGSDYAFGFGIFKLFLD
jgi:hypothetical protein